MAVSGSTSPATSNICHTVLQGNVPWYAGHCQELLFLLGSAELAGKEGLLQTLPAPDKIFEFQQVSACVVRAACHGIHVTV